MNGEKIKRMFSCFVLGCAVCLVGIARADNNDQAVDPAQIQAVQERILNDPEMMALVLSLQQDPEVQALLSEPGVAAAVRSGDFSVLANNPRIMKLLGKPQVQGLEKKLR